MKKENFNTALLIILILLFGCNVFPFRGYVTFTEVPAKNYLGKQIDGIRMIEAKTSFGLAIFGNIYEIGRPTQVQYFAIPAK